MTLDEQISQAESHVETGRLVIECQRALIVRHRTPESIELLDLFERTQRIFEEDLAYLLRKQPSGIPK